MEKATEAFTLSVIVPVYNEVTTREVLTQVARAPFVKEIIVVDDGATDGTTAVLQNLDTLKTVLATDSASAPFALKMLFHQRNQGKGTAIRTALDAVTGEIVLIQDADLEYNPAEYPQAPGTHSGRQGRSSKWKRIHGSRHWGASYGNTVSVSYHSYGAC